MMSSIVTASEAKQSSAAPPFWIASLRSQWAASAVVTSSSADTFIQQDRPAAGPQLAMTGND
jgi:hypothetical protein